MDLTAHITGNAQIAGASDAVLVSFQTERAGWSQTLKLVPEVSGRCQVHIKQVI